MLYEYWTTGAVTKKEDKLSVLSCFSGESGRILITIKNNQIYRTDMVLENEHLLTLDSFMELAHRAGYLIIRKDKLLSLSNEW